MPIKETKIDSQMDQPEGGMPIAKVLPALVVALVVIAGGSGAAAYHYYSQANELKTNPQLASQEETKALIARVSALIVLPTDEEPTIATVADPEKLKGQQFFVNAHMGDKVLIYTNARKAILFDPVAGKIIEVAPLSIGTGAEPQTAGANTEE